MDKTRQQEYIDLVGQLVQCQGETEDEVLATRPDLVDKGLVMALLSAAQMMTEENDPERESTVKWLNDFASQLATGLGLDMRDGDDSNEDVSNHLDFFQTLLQVVIESQGNGKIVHHFLDEHLERLSETFAAKLPNLVGMLFAQFDDADIHFQLASLIHSLAVDLTEFPRGDRAMNLELAINCCRLVLNVYTRAAYPKDWAMTQMELAVAYSNRIKGNRAENLEESIKCYRLALEIRTRDAYPKQWARTQMNLGNAYRNRIRGERAENLEESTKCYRLALEISTRAAYPEQWAKTQMELATGYKNRIRGNRAENLEESIKCYRLALEISTHAAYPEQWARIQNNLANAYGDRIRGERVENLEQSIECFRLALEIYTRAAYPEQWAKTHMNLANAYRNRIRGEQAENLEQSIECFRLALEICTRAAYPEDWAKTQMNLAIAYINRIRGDRAMNLELAIECCWLALEVYTRAAYPEDWAKTQMNLAIAYQEIDRVSCAINCYQSALEILTPELLPLECSIAASNLGDLTFKIGDWQLAIQAYELAMQAVETRRSWANNDESRQEILTQSISVYENAIQAAINLGDYQLAIEYTERFRSRQLVELMASKDLYGDAQVPVEIQAYLTEYQQLNEDIDNLREGSDRTMSATKTSRDSRALQADSKKITSLADRKQILYNKIRTHDPVLAGQIAIAPISHSEIQKLITNTHTAILTCYSTNDHTHIFILKQNQEPELFTCTGQGWTEFQQWLIENWLKPYQQQDNSAWRDRMPSVLAEIAERLQLPQLIANHLSDIQELVLVPHLLLHQIPFAALPTGKSEELLGEKFTIRSIPSCQILKYCQDRSPILTSTQGIVEDADDSLLGARYEGQKIAEIHGVREIDRLRGKSQATIANYRQLLSRVNRLHSSHHASSNLENPLESALSLADGKITLGDLLMGEKYPNLDEIFLSACETHLGKFTFTDDVTTLTTGFLCIGARSVQSTLWSVDDLVTALFDIFYHEARRDGLDRVRSLKAAQEKLRNLTGEEFKLYHYPKLIGYVTADSSARIATLKQQRKELHQQQSTLNNQTAEWQQIFTTMNDLRREVDSIKSSTIAVVARLNRYGESDRPFESPFYWAGFICQGMA